MTRKGQNARGASRQLSTTEYEKSVVPAYDGYLDRVDYDAIRGWAWNADQPNSPIKVDVYCDGVSLATIVADDFRLDLVEAGKGNGCHAFVFPVPFQLKNGKVYAIDVRISGIDIKLCQSPKMVKWPLQIVYDYLALKKKFRRRTFISTAGRSIMGRVMRRLTRDRDLSLIRSSGLFDGDLYLANNPDVAQARVDPLLHYLRYGGFEGRDPGPSFCSAWYLDTYEDVMKAGINPLVHYLKYGREEGRVVSNMATPKVAVGEATMKSESIPHLQVGNNQSTVAPLPVGQVHFGDLRRVTPISKEWGHERGKSIDRYYIERFLARNSADIQGRVLEIGDPGYTRTFGGNRVAQSDVLNVKEGIAGTTIVADLADAAHIPSDAFDCIIFTQTLQYLYNVRAALQTLYRILKPGGVLLATFPGITQTYDPEWADVWYWNFTKPSAQRLFEEIFPADNHSLQMYGNVLAAAAFLYGLAVEELDSQELDYFDPGYAVTIAVRALK
jgi:hypothetical protein